MSIKKPLAVLIAAVVAMTMTPATEAAVVYTENFDAFATAAVGGQNGWSATLGTPQIVVGDAGGTDKVMAGTSATAQGNARNASLYSIPATTTSIEITARMRLRGGNGNRIWFTDSAGTSIFGFGAGFGGFNFVVVTPDGPDVDTLDDKQYTGNVAGGSALSGSSHAWYDVRFTIDFNGLGDAFGLYEVRKDGQASFTTAVSGLDLNFLAAYENPALWTGLLAELRISSDQIDDIQISITVPAPAALPAGLTMVGLGMLRRPRRTA